MCWRMSGNQGRSLSCDPEQGVQCIHYEPHTSIKERKTGTDVRLDLPGLCCNVLHHWKKILHHQIRTVAAQLIEMLQANFPLLLLRTIRNAPQHIINCKMPLKKKKERKAPWNPTKRKIGKTSPHVCLSSVITGSLAWSSGTEKEQRLAYKVICISLLGMAAASPFQLEP